MQGISLTLIFAISGNQKIIQFVNRGLLKGFFFDLPIECPEPKKAPQIVDLQGLKSGGGDEAPIEHLVNLLTLLKLVKSCIIA